MFESMKNKTVGSSPEDSQIKSPPITTPEPISQPPDTYDDIALDKIC
jgi:hypothetical protein